MEQEKCYKGDHGAAQNAAQSEEKKRTMRVKQKDKRAKNKNKNYKQYSKKR